MVTRETSFPSAEYWQKFDTFLAYRKLKLAEAAAISEHAAFLDSQTKGWEDIGSIEPKGPMRTEKDFSFFLTRYMYEAVNIPLTKCVVVRDATIDFREKSWIMDSDLRFLKGGHLLILEMGSTNVPKGPWSNVTSGSVQVLIQLGESGMKEVAFTDKNRDVVKVINNFGGPSHKDDGINFELKVQLTNDPTMPTTGRVLLTSAQPTTQQEVAFENSRIPVFSLKEYVKHFNLPGDKDSDADAIYRKIMEKSEKAQQ